MKILAKENCEDIKHSQSLVINCAIFYERRLLLKIVNGQIKKDLYFKLRDVQLINYVAYRTNL